MKNIGIIGGMSPESTLLYYKYIIEEYRRRFKDHSYPIIIIYSVNFQKFIDWINKGDLNTITNSILIILHRLKEAGADFAVLATNTMHYLYDEISSKSPIPLLSIIDAVGEEGVKYGIKKVGLLGTKWTMTLDFYKNGLRKYGIETIVPAYQDIEYIDKIIFSELVYGVVNEQSKKEFIKIINKLKNEGAEAIILGCTEIPILIKQEDINIKILDSTKIHAYKTLEYSLSK